MLQGGGHCRKRSQAGGVLSVGVGTPPGGESRPPGPQHSHSHSTLLGLVEKRHPSAHHPGPTSQPFCPLCAGVLIQGKQGSQALDRRTLHSYRPDRARSAPPVSTATPGPVGHPAIDAGPAACRHPLVARQRDPATSHQGQIEQCGWPGIMAHTPKQSQGAHTESETGKGIPAQGDKSSTEARALSLGEEVPQAQGPLLCSRAGTQRPSVGLPLPTGGLLTLPHCNPPHPRTVHMAASQMLSQGNVPSVWSLRTGALQVPCCWRAGEHDQMDQEASSLMLEVRWVQPHPGLQAGRRGRTRPGGAWLPRKSCLFSDPNT